MPASDADKVRAVLAALPGTTEEIAEMLEKAGVRGVPNDCAECALARWVRKETGVRVEIYNQLAVVGGLARRGPRVSLPLRAELFAGYFDRGRWPDLVEPAAASA